MDALMAPQKPSAAPEEDISELHKSTCCGTAYIVPSRPTSTDRCSTWKELLEAKALELHGAAGRGGDPAAETYQEAENLIFRRAQQDSFPEEISLLKASKPRPVMPKMADLPPAHLHLFKPAFHSTGMDCFGPLQVKVGRRLENRWRIIV
ncbi:hypothetical protein SKAU_G00416140 [Synaphobranchus kaupii]|uniref:Uncharacterized protein n=1 Tax=Synaphobranchus kaupii TaxID=118154 RepID=A0A9Q1E7G9_SYNKA|nr:hypothetical protein SKAU_G00416140 [Synaphobranchus kaupii]